MSWTEEKIQQLRDGHAAGLSFSQIGDGIEMSRNACIGKARRLGLPVRVQANSTPTSEKPRTPRLSKRAQLFPFLVQQRALKPPRIVAPKPEYKSIGILDVRDDQCKFSVSNEGTNHHFCAAPVEPDKPFCPYHCGIAYDRSRRHVSEEGREVHRAVARQNFQSTRKSLFIITNHEDSAKENAA